MGLISPYREESRQASGGQKVESFYVMHGSVGAWKHSSDAARGVPNELVRSFTAVLLPQRRENRIKSLSEKAYSLTQNRTWHGGKLTKHNHKSFCFSIALQWNAEPRPTSNKGLEHEILRYLGYSLRTLLYLVLCVRRLTSLRNVTQNPVCYSV